MDGSADTMRLIIIKLPKNFHFLHGGSVKREKRNVLLSFNTR